MTEPCLNRRGSLIGSSFQLSAVRGLLGFTSCPENAIYKKWGLLQMWGSSNLTNRPTVVKESSERRYVHKSAWKLEGGGAGNGAFSALGLHVECIGGTMYGGGEATAGENWSLQDKLPKTHPCGGLADVRFKHCKQIQKQSGRKQEGSLSRKSVKEKKNLMHTRVKEIQLRAMS